VRPPHGKHTGHSFIRDNGELPTEGQLPILPGTATIGRMLGKESYATGVIGKWGLGGPGTSGEPNRQGFDHWFGYLCQCTCCAQKMQYLSIPTKLRLKSIAIEKDSSG
jgi:hypothetical protein